MRILLLLTFLISLTACIEEEKSDIQIITDKGVAISEDSYYSSGFTLTENADVHVTTNLISGPSIEVYFLDQEAYDLWLAVAGNGQYSDANFSYYQEFSRQPLSTNFQSGWHHLAKGRYYLLVENTNYGNTSPAFNGIDDIASVTIKIEVQP